VLDQSLTQLNNAIKEVELAFKDNFTVSQYVSLFLCCPRPCETKRKPVEETGKCID